MSVIHKKYLPYLILALFAAPLFFMNIHDGHGLGDDFAQYIKEAMNIAHGKPFYESNYVYNKYNITYAPPSYPPGFPLLLAPVVKIWGLSFPAMYYYNSLIAACLLFALFAYFRKHASTIAAVCLAILISYNEYMLGLKQNVLSDVPCLLFVTLYLLTRTAKTFTWQRITLLIALMVMAVLIRTNAFLLLAAEGTWLLLSFIKETIQNRKLSIKLLYTAPSIYIITGSIALLAFLNHVVFYSPVPASSFYGSFVSQGLDVHLAEVAKKQSGFLLTNLYDFFRYSEDDDLLKTLEYFTECMALVFIVFGFIISITKRLVVDDLFFILMCLLVIYLPVHDQRYFLNTIPLLYYYLYVSLKVITPAITTVKPKFVAIILTLMYVPLGCLAITNAIKTIPAGLFPHKKDYVAIEYLKAHINDTSIIIFPKPRLLTLFTNKKAMVKADQLSMEENKKIFDSFHVKYILIVNGLDGGYYKNYLDEVQHPIDSVQISDGYTLYTLR